MRPPSPLGLVFRPKSNPLDKSTNSERLCLEARMISRPVQRAAGIPHTFAGSLIAGMPKAKADKPKKEKVSKGGKPKKEKVRVGSSQHRVCSDLETRLSSSSSQRGQETC